MFTSQRPVHGDEKAVVLPGSGHDPGLVEDEGADAGSGSPQGRVDNGSGYGYPVTRVRDAAL